MKKILIFVLTAVMLVSLAACGRNNEATTPEDTTPQSGQVTDDMPTVDRNVPDPKVNDNSTDNTDRSSERENTNNDRDNTGTENGQNGILDDAMDKMTGQK